MLDKSCNLGLKDTTNLQQPHRKKAARRKIHSFILQYPVGLSHWQIQSETRGHDVIYTGQHPRAEKGNKGIWRGKCKISSYFTGNSVSQDAKLEPTQHHTQGNRQHCHFPKFSCVPLCFVFCFMGITLKMRSTILTKF